MAGFGNTVADVATVLGISKSALEAAIADVDHEASRAYGLGKADLRSSLRRAQVEAARGGNVTAQIWLGKQILGQRDVKKLELTGADGEPLKVEGDLAPVVTRRLEEYLRNRQASKRPGGGS